MTIALCAAFHHFSPMLAAALVASVWQGILMTSAVALLLQGLRAVPAATRTAVWTATLLLVMLLPVLNMHTPQAAQAVDHAELHVAPYWSVVFLSVWSCLSALRGVRLVSNAMRSWKLARRATPMEVSGRIAFLLQGTRRATLCSSGEINRPSVAGFFHPRVLLPQGLVETLSATELEHVVLHEMEHLRRRDDWLNLLQQISLVLLPLNPALIWLDRTLCRERELACDDGVLRATRAHKAYAACLVKLAEDSLVRKGLALALSALGTRARKSELVERVRRILAGPERVVGVRQTRFAVAMLAFAAACGTGMLARCPQLVRFDQATPQRLNVASSTLPPVVDAVEPFAAKAVSVRISESESSRPMLAKAVLAPASPIHAMRMVNAVSEPRVVRPRGVPRKAVAIARSARQWSTMPVVKAAVQNAPLADAAAWQPVATEVMPTNHVVITRFAMSQPMLAAVPWRGGWLIVQL